MDQIDHFRLRIKRRAGVRFSRLWIARFALLSSAFLITGTFVFRPANAQFGIPIPGQPQGRFIEPPRAIMQVINDANRAIEAGRISDAVVRLGDMLAREAVVEEDADLAGQDFFIGTGDARNKVATSMMREAERILASLPADGRDMYELRYGAKAKQMLAEATDSNDRDQLVLLSRRYLLTDAGMDGTMILAQLELSEGRAVAAMAILRRLAAAEAARQRFGNSLLLLLAEAEHLSEQDEAAAEHLIAASQMGSALGLTAKNRPSPNPGKESEWLEEQFGSFDVSSRNGLLASRERSSWIARGGEAGLGAGEGNLPLSRIRWMQDAVTSRPQQRMLESFIADNKAQIPPPSWQPIKVGSQLLIRTTERLMAIDFETGKFVWEYPWSNGPTSEDDKAVRVEQLGNIDEAEQLLVQKIWNDLPYGRVTSDGKRVYLLEDLGAIESVSFSQFGMPVNRTNRPADNSSNTLVALELSSEGKLVWMRGREGIEPDQKSLSDAFFLGPPLPLEDKLYQMAELTGDIYLICLQAETGTELWRQQILGNDGGRVASDPMRRIAGAMPAASNGILVCPTGAGAVVAVDLVSQSLLWGHKLPTNDANNPYLRNRSRYSSKPNQLQLMNRWLDGTPTISGATVLVTPVESDRLYAFDLLTGTPQWSPILRNDFRYLAGCREDQFFLVSGSRMQAFSIKTGQPTWAEPAMVVDDEQISGTGVFGENSYFLPTTSGALIEVELATGKILSRREVGYGLGNLLADGDSLISQTAISLSAAYAEQPLREMVDERLTSNPDDKWALVRQGELLLENGKREEAIEWLLKARQFDETDEEVRMLLVDAMLTSIRNGRRVDAETTALLDELIELTPQRIELLRFKAMAALDAKQPVDAVNLLIELSTIVLQDELTLRTQSPNFQLDPKHKTLIDAWCAAYLARAISIANDEQLASIDALVEQHLEPKKSQTGSIRRRALAQFTTSLASKSLRGAVWTAAIDDGQLGRAERICLDALMMADRLENADSNDRQEWLAKLAFTYQRAGFSEDALAYARQANKAFLENEENDSATLATSDLYSPAQMATENTIAQLDELTRRHPWPKGVKLTLADDPSRSNNPTQRQRNSAIHVRGIRGIHMKNWLPRLERGAVLLRDPLGFEHRIDVQGPNGNNDMMHVTMDGGVMILLTNEELIAVDLLSLQLSEIDPVLWRRRWWNQTGIRSVVPRSESEFFRDTHKHFLFETDRSAQGTSTSGAMRLGPIVGRRLFVLQGQDLTAIDLITGEEVWRVGTSSTNAFVVASPTAVGLVDTNSGVQVFNYDDGQLLKKDVWEPSETGVITSGKYFLTQRLESIPANAEQGTNEKNRKTVRLVSPIDGKEVLSLAVDNEAGVQATAYARLIDGRYMFLLTVDGRFVFWDLAEGRQVCDQKIDTGGNLTGFNVLRNQYGFLLSLIRHEDREKNADPARQLYIVDGQEHVETDGPLIAISPEDGSVLWRYDLEGTWGISIDQPADSPVAILSRSEMTFNDTSKGVRTLDLLAIDMRTGELAAAADRAPIASNLNTIGTEVRVQPEQNLVEVSISRYVFMLEFVDEDIAPEDRTLNAETLKKMLEENQVQSDSMQLRTIDIFAPPR